MFREKSEIPFSARNNIKEGPPPIVAPPHFEKNDILDPEEVLVLEGQQAELQRLEKKMKELEAKIKRVTDIAIKNELNEKFDFAQKLLTHLEPSEGGEQKLKHANLLTTNIEGTLNSIHEKTLDELRREIGLVQPTDVDQAIERITKDVA